MPRKQAIINDSAAGAAPARAAKTKAPRVKSAKHAKSSLAPEIAAAEVQPKLDSLDPTLNLAAAEADSAEPVAVLEIIEEVVTSSSSAYRETTPSTSPAAATTNGAGRNEDPREEIARIAYGYWAARGYAPGDPLEDWVRAENEYNARQIA